MLPVGGVITACAGTNDFANCNAKGTAGTCLRTWAPEISEETLRGGRRAGITVRGGGGGGAGYESTEGRV